jgi:hypothetical protein
VLRIARVCYGIGFRDLGGGDDGERSFMRFRSVCECFVESWFCCFWFGEVAL